METALGPGQTYGASIPIVSLTDAQSVAVITNLCFASLWLGALGWEVIMTLAFDLRLLRQTEWRSVPACIHSLAYYVSRYSTVAFIATYVATNAQTVSSNDAGTCQQRITAAAAFFVISECSILLVFITRTIALWNMDRRIIAILTVAWLAAVGINLTLPGYGSGAVMAGFCFWQIKGGWVGASMIAMAICSLLCLVLTVGKLNSHGWRGLWQSMQPSHSRSIDAEDVSRVLVQRTTCFFFIMLLSIIVADVVYYTVDFTLWKLIAVPAYLAIAASLAGRIFRRSWKMTRSVEHSRPPSYYPGVWKNDVFQRDIDRSSTSTQPRTGRLHIYHHSNSHPSFASYNRAQSKLSEDKFVFVEGQFRSPFRHLATLSDKSLPLPEPEEVGAPADEHTGDHFDDILLHSRPTHRRASEPAVHGRRSAMISDEEIRPMTGDSDHIAIDMPAGVGTTACEPLRGAFGISEAPTFLPRARTRTRAVSRKTAYDETYAWDTKRRMQQPSTAPSRDDDRRRFVDTTTPTATYSSLSRPTTASSIDSSSSVYATPKNNEGRWSSLDVSTMPTLTQAASQFSAAVGGDAIRDDLVMTPTRTRLWLDSSAERARMEALIGPSSSRMSDADSIYASSNAGSSTRRSAGSLRSRQPSSIGRRTINAANKRLILESAGRAGDNLSRQGNGSRKHEVDFAVADANDPLRSGFLPSPAIVPALDSAGLHADREMYDLDAMQRKLTTVPPVVSTSARPQTAPGNVNEQQQSMAVNRQSMQDQPNANDLLDAFRHTVAEEDESSAVDERPRTSRGTRRLGSFGQHDAAAAAVNEVTMRRTASLSNERLRTRSSGNNADVKPFGQHNVAMSAIEQQYMRLRSLAAHADERDHLTTTTTTTTFGCPPTAFFAGSALVSSLTPLERIDSCSTINSTHDSHHHRRVGGGGGDGDLAERAG